MRESQIMQLDQQRWVNLAERWYVMPPTKKRSKTSRHPKPLIRIPTTDADHQAFVNFFTHGCAGPFSPSSARRLFARAVKVVQEELRTELHDPTFTLPHIRPTDLRHSYGTEVLRQTNSLETTAEMMGHTTTRMTKRYALGAISEV
jgi:integrase